MNVRDAYADGVGKGIFPLFIPDCVRQWAAGIEPLDTITDDELLSLAYDSKTASRREHSYPVFYPDTAWQQGWTVELARIVIPSGNLGIIRRIDTLVLDATTGQPISPWNNPDSWDSVFQFSLIYNLLTDESVQQRVIRLFGPVPSPLPWYYWQQCQGLPLPTIEPWTDDRYSWGNPSNSLDLHVPKQAYVRLFVTCLEDTRFIHGVRGRLVSTIQTESSISAAWMARRGSHG